MTSKRSYRDPIPQQKVREEFVKGAGTQFDPEFARIMLHLIDKDSEYTMKENEEVKELVGKNELICEDFRSSISEGIIVTRNITHIRLKSTIDNNQFKKGDMPAIILFDSLDGRVYTDDKLKKDLLYYEYCEIWFDGRVENKGVRKINVDVSDNNINSSNKNDTNSHKHKKSIEYSIDAVKFLDHVLINIKTAEKQVKIVIALPDSTRYAYIGLTGKNCHITDVSINKDAKAIDENYIPRIAEKISYIDVPAGDIPNVQIDGYRTDSTEGIKIEDGLRITFHTMSLPTARLVWHCPFLSIFYSKDKKIDGPNYHEFALIRFDGENWDAEQGSVNKLIVNKTESFENWDVWKATNKKGYDCEVIFKKNGNVITTLTENAGIKIQNITTLNVDLNELYVALSGDQCALTNIHIHKK